MHPAFSVILFTTLSGMGFGLMFWLGMGSMQVSGFMAASVCALALGLASIGLVASTFHLGHPERALKAFSQWRSSWLSREGIVSVAALIAFALYALFWVVFGDRDAVLGWVAAILAILTVFATAMIYAQLRTVPRWNTPLTPLLFVLYALAVPALLTGEYVQSFGFLIVLSVVQFAHWFNGDKGLKGVSTPESATGLGALGKVHLLEAPNSSPNYLMKEMVHHVGRKRAASLRKVVMVLALAVPLLIALISLIWGLNHLLLLVAFAAHLIGTFASRWLFFAEAEHVVGLFYGQR